MIFLNDIVQSKSSIEESDNFASNMSFSAFLMGEDALGGGEHEMAELSGGEDVAGPFFEFRENDVVPGRDDSALVDPSNELNDNLLASVIIDDFKLSNIVVFLHDSQELDENLGGGSEEDLLLAFPFSIDDGFKGISEDINFDHCGIE